MTDTTPPERPTPTDTFLLRADRFRVLIAGEDTSGRLSVLDVRAHRGFELPIHVHEAEDEIVTVLDGQVCVNVGGNDVLLHPFDTVLLKRAVPHALRLLTESARLLVTYTPAGFERYLRAVAEAGPNALEGGDPRTLGPPNVPALVRIGETFRLRYFPEPSSSPDFKER